MEILVSLFLIMVFLSEKVLNGFKTGGPPISATTEPNSKYCSTNRKKPNNRNHNRPNGDRHVRVRCD